MAKRPITLTIDAELLAEAKSLGLNISAAAEHGVQQEVTYMTQVSTLDGHVDIHCTQLDPQTGEPAKVVFSGSPIGRRHHGKEAAWALYATEGGRLALVGDKELVDVQDDFNDLAERWSGTDADPLLQQAAKQLGLQYATRLNI